MSEDQVSQALELAWSKRPVDAEAVRVFHGPGEGDPILRPIAIDRFGSHAWVTAWGEFPRRPVARFLESKGLRSAVVLERTSDRSGDVPSDPTVLYGAPPAGRYECREGAMVFRVQLLGVKHPGLFLDHAPLRAWLSQHARGMRVLNTFAYTGSLSVACGVGGAEHVTTLDLSKPTIRWAEDNWAANALKPEMGRFVYGDVFDWMPRMRKRGERFDCVIVDPPSFSRGTQGTFSTARDLARLHEVAVALIEPGGMLVTSINSANVTREAYLDDVHDGARGAGRDPKRLSILHEIAQPASFPWRADAPDTRYLKGWVMKCQ